ncbi:hypothetical protein BGZ51_003502 [Haplosporangium sp. Z 767]|nr:hypothetical protein BGZ51_003502 [Haplosporangium sp. Z 767]KAF9184909.1 hypothetical protein BGZ50_003405 [Haplosporangium sp. Z 11]
MHSSSLTIPKQEGRGFNTGNISIGSNSNNLSHSQPDETLSAPTLRTRAAGAWNDSMKPLGVVWTFLKRKTNLTIWIVIAMVVGILVGRFAPKFAASIGPLGSLFIRMIQCIVGPLIFSTLVIGIAGHGDDLVRVGRLALKSAVYFIIVTALALILGAIAVNVVRPGAGFNTAGLPPPESNVTKITWVREMEIIVPTSFFLAMSDHSAVLAIVFCAIMFSVAITRADEKSKRFMLDFNASLSGIMFKVVELVMNYAPIGIGCAIAATVGEYGLSALAAAGKLVLTLYVTLLLFAFIVLLPILVLFRFPLKDFAWAAGQPVLMAFATSSSESALPTAMENMVEFGVPPEIVAFVIPTGYSFNLDGSTLYLAIATIFCAQVADIEKTVGQQIVIVLTLMLTSRGVAAVPRASYIVLANTLANANIPLEGLALIMSVDAFMDMARTAINVLGNMIACAVIAKWENEFRNEAWVARKSGQMPETLVMDDHDTDAFNLSQHHQQQIPNHHHYPHQSPNLAHSTPLPMHDQLYHAEKASIHSVQSVHSSVSAYEHPHHSSSTRRQHSNYGDAYL